MLETSYQTLLIFKLYYTGTTRNTWDICD